MNELTKGCTLQHGKYRIVKTLGRGSFGITYLATINVALSGGLGKMEVTVNVAIKEFFMEELNSRSRDGYNVEDSSSPLVKSYRRKFYREAENLARLHHPNIVKVLEVFDENNTTYYAMEYVDGESLDDYIMGKGRLPESEVLSQLLEIGSALKHMHDSKMLHLDLKPKNIMRNKDGHLLLIDFGLSKQYDQKGKPESSTALGRGTPGYAPIEQANYKQDGTFPATLDIYALGATMYKMLTGSTPPHASEILGEGFPEELFLKLRISSEITAMVEKAMSPRKKQRYQSVSELLEESKIANSNVTEENGFGSYEKIVGEAEYGTEEVTNVEIDDPFPVPDSGICIVLRNPNPGTLSYQFNLNEGICNTVLVYRDGRKILDEEYFGGIRTEVVEALRRNGFFSKVRWEREVTTTLVDGITFSCSFHYKSGDRFVCKVKDANPEYYHLLLDAVNDVVKVPELSCWIDEALNREHEYSIDDIEQYGISVFSFAPDDKLLIYYRGNIYSDDDISTCRLKSYSEVEPYFEKVKYYLRKNNTNRIDFDSYLRNHKEEIGKKSSFNIITYCSESDLLKIFIKLRQNPSVFGRYRIVQEMQLLPLCFNCVKDEVIGYEYQHLYCEAMSGGGVVYILQAGLIGTGYEYTTETSVKKISNFDSFAYLMLSSTIQHHILNKTWEEDGLLQTIMPFAIKAEVWKNGRYREGLTLIERNMAIPHRHSEIISEKDCSIVILCLGKRFSVDVNDLFRYNPRTIELTAEIDANISIKYVLRDKEMKKEITISQAELFNYELKNNNENTLWKN